MDHEPEQVFYKLSELSEMLGVENSVLRFWEKEFTQVKPMKVGPRKRLYRRKDLEVFQEIKRLLYEERFTIAGAKKRLSGPSDSRQRRLFGDEDDKIAGALAESAADPNSDREQLKEARSRLAETRLALMEIKKILSGPLPGRAETAAPPRKKRTVGATSRKKSPRKKAEAAETTGASEK